MHVNKISWSYARDYEHRGGRSVVIPSASVTGENGTPFFGFETQQLNDTTLYGLGFQAKNFANVTTSKKPDSLEMFFQKYSDIDNPELHHTSYTEDEYIISDYEDLRFQITVDLDKIKGRYKFYLKINHHIGYTANTYLLRTSKSDIPFCKQPCARMMNEENPTTLEKTWNEIKRHRRRIGLAVDNFNRFGTSLRLEATFTVSINDQDVHRLYENPLLGVITAVNEEYSKWADDTIVNCARTVQPSIFPGVIKVNSEALCSLIWPIMNTHLNGNYTSVYQKEFVAFIERMLYYNLTGFVKDLGNSFLPSI